jgi:predicted ribosome quality control (RQC) complex YloA/Tae2 family protein
MDNFFLNAVVAEIAPIVRGRRVSSTSAYGLRLELGLGEGEGAMVISLDPAAPGIYHTKHIRRSRKHAPTPNETAATRFLGRLIGAELIAISKAPFDRIVRVEFNRHNPDDVGAEASAIVTLVLMLTGRSANIYLQDESGNREAMLPDRGWPDAAKPACDLSAEWQAATENATADEILARYFGAGSPFSPILKSEFLVRCRSHPPPKAFASLLSDLERQGPPLVYSSLPMEEAGKRLSKVRNGLVLSCIELASTQGLSRYEFDTYCEAAQFYYRLVGQAARFVREHDALRRKLGVEIKKSRTSLNAVQADLEKLDDPERFKRYGDLILANLATARIEQGLVRVRDYYEPNAPEIEIEVGENTSLQKASARFYLQYRKALRGLKTLRPRARSLADRIQNLEEMLAALCADPAIDRVREIGVRLEALTGAKRPGAHEREKKKDKAARQMGRRFTSSDGYEVVVGRNDRENDFITFRLAGSQDIWLHAADYPGSHVVVRNPRREAVPFRTILEAAEAAAFYSQARKEAKAAVYYTQKKYVSKPPRSKPGLARLSSFKTAMVEPKKK